MSFTRYRLYLRFHPDAFEDLTELTRFETRIIDELGSFVKVERHDVTSGQLLVTVHTTEPDFSFFICKCVLEAFEKLDHVTAAHRFLMASNYTVLWPENYTGEFEV